MMTGNPAREMVSGAAVLTISTGYDPGYLTHAVATGRENYYLSAVAEYGEPPGIWTGEGCLELGLVVGSEVDPAVMERLYGAFIDPRDPEGRRRAETSDATAARSRSCPARPLARSWPATSGRGIGNPVRADCPGS